MSFSVFVAHISCLFYVLVIFFLVTLLLPLFSLFFFFNDTATTEIYTLSLHDALPICLFDPQRKRAIPRFPAKIAVITSPTGAVIQDILQITRRRCPWLDIVDHREIGRAHV